MSALLVRFAKTMLRPFVGEQGLDRVNTIRNRSRFLVTSFAGRLRLPQLKLLLGQLRDLPPRPYRGKLQRHVVMLVVSDIRIDPRVQKAAKAAVGAGFRVTVVSPHYEWMDDKRWVAPDWGPGIEFEFPRVASMNFLNHDFPWLVDERLFAFCREHYRNVIFHCNDLNTALMGVHLARATGSVSVSDFHEWFSENVTWSARRAAYVPHGRLKRAFLRRAEQICIRHADHGITVCDSIAAELQKIEPAGRRFTVVRNIPDLTQVRRGGYPSLKQQLGLPESTFVVLWQGGVGPSRLLEPVIESLRLAQGVHLVIRGPGLEPGAHYRKYYEDYAIRFGVSDRLTLLPPVPSRDVVAAAAGADAGLWTLPNLSKNFYLALPNKLFEYLAARLPVLVANFPEASALVQRYQVGLQFDPYSPQSIADSMARLRDDPALAETMRANTVTALADMNAAAEWAQVPAIYESLVERAEAGA